MRFARCSRTTPKLDRTRNAVDSSGPRFGFWRCFRSNGSGVVGSRRVSHAVTTRRPRASRGGIDRGRVRGARERRTRARAEFVRARARSRPRRVCLGSDCRGVDRTGTRVRARRAPWAAAAAEGGACTWRRRLSRRTRRTSSTARTRRAMTRTRTSGCVRRPLSSPPRHSPRARIRHARDRPRPPRARRDLTHGGAARAPGRRRTRRFRTRVCGRPTDDARPSRSVPRIAPLEIGSLTNTLSERDTRVSTRV